MAVQSTTVTTDKIERDTVTSADYSKVHIVTGCDFIGSSKYPVVRCRDLVDYEFLTERTMHYRECVARRIREDAFTVIVSVQ